MSDQGCCWKVFNRKRLVPNGRRMLTPLAMEVWAGDVEGVTLNGVRWALRTSMRRVVCSGGRGHSIKMGSWRVTGIQPRGLDLNVLFVF